MRIGNFNTFAQSCLFSGTGKIGNVQLPDYTDFHFNTQKSPAMNDDKYKEAIVEQAKKDQAAGKFQSESSGFRNLVKSYVSVSSPDRKGIITESLTAVFKKCLAALSIKKKQKICLMLSSTIVMVKW
ncbi:MAG: hypothetical protein LBQ71_04415 [Hungatella sp.]|jgi:hypothetical protein|nr:hypothetical protein [Hungatella sp.]